MALLVCRDLAVGYGGKSVLEGISFKVEKGDYLFITGANGTGKSTLMKTILGLLSPVEGKIMTGDGLKIGDAGYLPQQKDFQKDFPASVNEIVISGCQGKCGLRPFYSREEKHLARKAIERMGISHLANRCYRELSGGQQQRVLLARAPVSYTHLDVYKRQMGETLMQQRRVKEEGLWVVNFCSKGR